MPMYSFCSRASADITALQMAQYSLALHSSAFPFLQVNKQENTPTADTALTAQHSPTLGRVCNTVYLLLVNKQERGI